MAVQTLKKEENFQINKDREITEKKKKKSKQSQN
jgi:hypothetical protein